MRLVLSNVLGEKLGIAVLGRVLGKVQEAVLGLAGLAVRGGALAYCAGRSTWTADGQKCWARCQRPCLA
jgi:hypothetical protein